MAKLFYDHLIIIEEIVAVLDTHNLSPKDKQTFLELIDKTMHHHILDAILTHLPEEHHETFLKKLHGAPHDPNIMSFLKEHSSVDIEKEILKQANTVKKTLLKEIEKVKTP